VPTIAVVFRKSRLDVDIRMGSLLIYLPLAWGRVTVSVREISDLNPCARIQE
jgi:hypothetical protein